MGTCAKSLACAIASLVNAPQTDSAHCSVCGKEFAPRNRYQVDSSGQQPRYYCSLPCKAGMNAAVACGCCGKSFVVTYAYQAQRGATGNTVYSCSDVCLRTQMGAPTHLPTTTIAPVGPSPAVAATSSATRTPVAASPQQVRPYRIAVLNQKGGTGKTTTSVSVAAGLAMREDTRVLLVDCDPQGNVGHSLGKKPTHTLYHVLMDKVSAHDAMVKVNDRLHLLMGDDTLAAAEIQMAQHPARGSVLSKRLHPLEQRERFTHVVVDCGPSLSLINQNALCYVDEVIVPVACDYLSLVGVKQVLKTVKNIQTHLGHPVRVGGIVPTMYDGRAKICRDALLALQDHFGALCLEPIRNNTKLKEAPSVQKTIFEHDPSSTGAVDYRRVVEYIAARGLAHARGELAQLANHAAAVSAPVTGTSSGALS
jgi:chromosome partitioning protein